MLLYIRYHIFLQRGKYTTIPEPGEKTTTRLIVEANAAAIVLRFVSSNLVQQIVGAYGLATVVYQGQACVDIVQTSCQICIDNIGDFVQSLLVWFHHNVTIYLCQS